MNIRLHHHISAKAVRLAAIVAALAGVACPITLPAAPVSSPETVGYVTTAIRGTAGTAESALTFIGLSVTEPIVFHTAAVNFSGSSRTLACSNYLPFQNGQFDNANGPHFAEITSGPNAGASSDIIATSAAGITIADDWSTKITGNEKIKIRRHWTLQSVFGPASHTGNQVALVGGGASSADQVLVFDRASQQYVTYYYKQGGITGGTGWRSTAGADPLSTDRSQQALPITEGIIVRRKAASDVTLYLPGAVKFGATERPVLPGLNLAGNLYASGATLANSGLYDPNNPSASLRVGTATTADLLLIYDGAEFHTYYYKVGGLAGGDGWRSTSGADPLGTDVSNTPLSAGESVIINRAADQPFNWKAPQPFTAP